MLRLPPLLVDMHEETAGFPLTLEVERARANQKDWRSLEFPLSQHRGERANTTGIAEISLSDRFGGCNTKRVESRL